MYSNMTANITIEYYTDLISKIKEMINDGLDKLKTFVNTKNKSKFNFYYELDKKFDEIALKLEKYEFLNDELNYFLLITEQILYIIDQNVKNSSFGHCTFALELFEFFIEIWDAKIKLSENFSEIELEKYAKLKLKFKDRYHAYRREFYWNIYRFSDDFNEEEMYEIAKSLRE